MKRFSIYRRDRNNKVVWDYIIYSTNFESNAVLWYHDGRFFVYDNENDKEWDIG
jgi:hypothetical protein